MKGAIFLCSHSNGDIFTCEDNMLFSHVKISSFCAKAHLVFHWCLYNKRSYFNSVSAEFEVWFQINYCVVTKDPRTHFVSYGDSMVLERDSWFSTRWVPAWLIITICNKITALIRNIWIWEMCQCDTILTSTRPFYRKKGSKIPGLKKYSLVWDDWIFSLDK